MKKKNILIGFMVFVCVFIVVMFSSKYLDLQNEVSELNGVLKLAESSEISEKELSDSKYNDIVLYYESEIDKEQIISQNRLETINELQESMNLLYDAEFYISNLNLYGLTSEMILEDLVLHPELIPFKGVLGGNVGWSISESFVLTDRYVFAQFDDGHYLGHALLAFEVVNDKFTWSLYDADVLNDDLMGKITLGDSIYCDLNGDGEYESINYDLDDLSIGLDSWGHVIQDVVYNDNPHEEKYILVDIDVKDHQREIGLMAEGPSNDYTTHFYSYDGINLIGLGSVPFLVEDLKEQLDEEGNVYGQMRLDILQTWFAESRWTLVKNKLVHSPKGLFDVSSDRGHSLLVALPIYKNMGSKNTYSVMAPQQVKFLLTDNKNWCKVEGEDGSVGWFKIEGFNYLPDVELRSEQVFENLNFAD